jgi:hypothetical protein
MTVIVEVPGHGEVEFPDGMSDADMESAIRKNFMITPKTPESPSFLSRMGSVGSAGAQGLMRGGPVAAAAGMMGEGMKQGDALFQQAGYNAGGAVTDKLAGVVPPEVAAGAGFATNVATQAIPTVVGGVLGREAAPLAERGGKFLMQSALKPSKLEHQSGKAARAVQTMLDEGVNVSKGGVDKMRSSINSLNDEIAGIIKNSGAKVDKNAVASRLQDVIKKYEASIDPSDLEAVEGVWTKFLSHPQLAGQKDMAIQLAQRMKQAGGAKLGDAAYGQGLKPASERDAWKALVRGLKEEIAAAEPKVSGLNKRESDLINASKIASNRVAMDANKNPLGLGALISQPWMLPLWMWDRSPMGKSLAARALYSGAGPLSVGAGAGLGGLYGAEQGSPGALYQK